MDWADRRQHPGYNRVTERLVQIVVESAIDISEKLVEAMNEPVPATARESFEGVSPRRNRRRNSYTIAVRRFVESKIKTQQENLNERNNL
jgi:hypothetical protein